jgi:threonine dehydratase
MSRMSDVIKCTDLSLTRKMSPHGGFQLFLKREDQQLGFSPHVRGIYNSMSHITPENRWRGVVIPSKGRNLC